AVQMVSTEPRLRALGWVLILSNALAGSATIAAARGVGFVPVVMQEPEYFTGIQRYGGISAGEAMAAMYSLVGIVFALNYLLSERNLLLRVVLVACLVLLVWAMVYTYALTMWLSTILACALSLLPRGGINLKNVLKATVVGGILACLVVAFIPGFQ